MTINAIKVTVDFPLTLQDVNSQKPSMANCCLILFAANRCDLGQANQALQSIGLTVIKKQNYLHCFRSNSPEFRIYLASGEDVLKEAQEIGEKTPFSAELQSCDARFEITFDSLDEVLDEINTLMEIQVTLQEAADGFVFTPWNGNLNKF